MEERKERDRGMDIERIDIAGTGGKEKLPEGVQT